MKKTKEIWVPCKCINNDGIVLSFENYEVSSLGRVRSLNYHHTGKAKVLSPGTIKGKDGSIYYNVVLRKNNKTYTKTVHRLVLSSFNPEGWSENAVVNHKSERTPTSCINKLSNLEWTTQKENVNTDHRKELLSRAHTNRKDLSKRVKVTDLSTGESTVYHSARETERALCLPHRTVSTMIKKQKGYYKKMNLMFSYVV